jgi:two-component system, NtrC family, response regulator
VRGRILIVDDEDMKRVALRCEAQKLGYEADDAPDALQGLEKVRSSFFDVVVTDLRMPRMDGLTFLRKIGEVSPDTSVLLMTAFGSVENAVEAIKAGAHDYLLKPFSADELFLKVARALEFRETLALNRVLLDQDDDGGTFHRLVGTAPTMQRVYRQIARVARSPATVLVTGESGTGKELVADAIHKFSDRSGQPLVKVSCGALARDVIDSELFGHVEGAFTGATRDRRGRFEAADGGTLYLDDVDDVPLEIQVKLLRALQNREVERVGGDRTIHLDVRLVASTKVDLEGLVRAGRYREDLFYRLNVVEIRLPSLRERRSDIPLLARHFLKSFAKQTAGDVRGFDQRAMAALCMHSWPGNVRELENAIERAVTFARGDLICPADLPEKFDGLRADQGPSPIVVDLDGRESVNLPDALRSAEESMLCWALARADGNQGRAAQMLGIPRTTLRDRLTRLGLGPRNG